MVEVGVDMVFCCADETKVAKAERAEDGKNGFGSSKIYYCFFLVISTFLWLEFYFQILKPFCSSINGLALVSLLIVGEFILLSVFCSLLLSVKIC